LQRLLIGWNRSSGVTLLAVVGDMGNPVGSALQVIFPFEPRGDLLDHFATTIRIRAPANSISIVPAGSNEPGVATDARTTLAGTKPIGCSAASFGSGPKQLSPSEQQRARNAIAPRRGRNLPGPL
jgi:hypothetical protein